MSETEKIALMRGLINGAIAAGGAFFAALAVVAGDGVTASELTAALVGAGGAFFGGIAWRGGAESQIDKRNPIQREADEQKKVG